MLRLEDNCSESAEDSLNIGPALVFEVDNIIDSVCEPYTVLWETSGKMDSEYSYSWKETRREEFMDIQKGATYQSGTYEFGVYAVNNLGCKDSILFPVVVKEVPSKDFTWSPDLPSVDDTLVLFSALEKGAIYVWKLNGDVIGDKKEIYHEFSESGNYVMDLLVSKDGCLDSNRVIVDILDGFTIHNITAFSPNGDNINDTYKPYVKGVAMLKYRIYNRWGEEVHSGNLDTPPWDGTYQGEVVENGAYVVLHIIQKRDGKKSKFTTILNVVR
jgi:gliding motility-associated-like protein